MGGECAGVDAGGYEGEGAPEGRRSRGDRESEAEDGAEVDREMEKAVRLLGALSQATRLRP